MAVTIRDVAVRAGTSIAAVSAVLHNSGKGNIRVGEATRARIVSAARELGYVANTVARSLATGRNGVVGILLPYERTLINQDPFCSQLLGGVTDELVRSGYDLLLHTSLGDSWQQADPNRLTDPRIDGLIFAVPYLHSPILERCLAAQLPCVPVIYPQDQEVPCTVNADDFAGGHLATQHLLELGHQRIVHFQGAPEVSATARRTEGFRAAMAEAGLPVSPAHLIPCGFAQQDGYAAMQRLLHLPRSEQPTAIFAANDLSASGVFRAIQEAGLRVPEDFSVVGFDDTPLAGRLRPSLTTIHASIYTMGVLAAGMLIALVEKRPVKQAHPVLPVELKLRHSTAAPALPPV